MRLPDDGGLGDLRVAHEPGLPLHRADSVARDIDYVVDAPHQPEVAVLVCPGTVSREVRARDLRPVDLVVPARVLEDRLEHRGPWLRDHEVPALVDRDGAAVLVHDLRA